MPGNVLTTTTGLYDPAQMFSLTLVPVTGSSAAVSGSTVTIGTATAHGFGAVLTAFQKVPGYNVSTGQGLQLGVIISGGAGSLILNSTWLVVAAPTTTTFTITLSTAQVGQLGAISLTGATVTPFMTLTSGWWDFFIKATDTIQWSTTNPPGPVGGANTTVGGVVGGSILAFSALGNATGAPIGGGTYSPWQLGVGIPNGDSIQTDGVTYFLQFGATAGTTRAFKRL